MSPRPGEDYNEAAHPFEVQRFELKDAITAGSSGLAYYMYWDSALQDYVKSDSEETLHEALEQHNWGIGDKVYAMFWHDSRRWEILSSAGGSGIIRFQVDNVSGFATTDATFDATVEKIIAGPVPDAVNDQVTIQNFPSNKTGNYNYYGDDNDYGFAKYSPEEMTYHAIDMECP